MSGRRTRRARRASRGEWIGAVVVLLVIGAAWQLLAHLGGAPAWLVGVAGFVFGILVTLAWQRWINRTMYRLGYVRVRGRY